MSCERPENQNLRWPDEFDNIGDVYDRLPDIPPLNKLGGLMGKLADLETFRDIAIATTNSSLGKAIGGSLGAIIGGGIGTAFGVFAGYAAFGALASIGAPALLGAVAAYTIAGTLIYLGSVAGEELYGDGGEIIGGAFDQAYGKYNESSNGSDPSSGCPENEGQSGMGGPFHNGPNTPLILDMDGDGVELISLESSSTLFDIDNDNFAERTGWVGKDDAWLAIDHNNNGIIDNQNELFGNAGFFNAFDKLHAYDTNADNQITSADAHFGHLLVRTDAEKSAA